LTRENDAGKALLLGIGWRGELSVTLRSLWSILWGIDPTLEPSLTKVYIAVTHRDHGGNLIRMYPKQRGFVRVEARANEDAVGAWQDRLRNATLEVIDPQPDHPPIRFHVKPDDARQHAELLGALFTEAVAFPQ
jgi:hypothetical protein